jgi:hypothetical protein
MAPTIRPPDEPKPTACPAEDGGHWGGCPDCIHGPKGQEPTLTPETVRYVLDAVKVAAVAVAGGYDGSVCAVDFMYRLADLWRGGGDAPDALACCDRHALDPLHGGPCAAWVGFPCDSEDGCEVILWD